MYKKVLLVCVVAAAAYGQEFELKWDTGTYCYQLCYDKGPDTWYANDFDTAGYD